MTRKEAISIMNVIVHMLEPQYDTDHIENAVEMAIKALEQEPILDKIRDEIVEMRSKQNVGVLECLDIIDKYRGESDCHECKAEHDCYECEKYEESEEK